MVFFVFSGLSPKMINARSKNFNLVYPTSPALPPPPIDFLANWLHVWFGCWEWPGMEVILYYEGRID